MLPPAVPVDGPQTPPPPPSPLSPPASPCPTPPKTPSTSPLPPPSLTPPTAPAPNPVPLIIDTDMSFDVDDVGALCLAHSLADRGEVSILATMHDAGVPSGIGAVSVLNDYYGRSDVPLGAFKGAFGRLPHNRYEWNRGPYVDRLVANFPSTYQDSSQVPDAVRTYRRVLAAASNQSVVIAAIGFTTNLAALLESPPDEMSPATGRELLAAKVRRVVYQGGKYPHGSRSFNWDCGGEWYYHKPDADDGCNGTSAQVVNGLTALGVEQQFTDLGQHTFTGEPLAICAPAFSPCRDAFIAWLGGRGFGRPSWDEVAILLAARGSEGLTLGSSPGRSAFELVRGLNVVAAPGGNRWSANVSRDGGIHSYLKIKSGYHRGSERKMLAMEIDHLLCQPPKRLEEIDYQSRFGELNSPAPPPSPPAPPRLPYVSPPHHQRAVTCGDCWGIHRGARGDCSSIQGCGYWLCDFCTNH